MKPLFAGSVILISSCMAVVSTVHYFDSKTSSLACCVILLNVLFCLGAVSTGALFLALPTKMDSFFQSKKSKKMLFAGALIWSVVQVGVVSMVVHQRLSESNGQDVKGKRVDGQEEQSGPKNHNTKDVHRISSDEQEEKGKIENNKTHEKPAQPSLNPNDDFVPPPMETGIPLPPPLSHNSSADIKNNSVQSLENPAVNSGFWIPSIGRQDSDLFNRELKARIDAKAPLTSQEIEAKLNQAKIDRKNNRNQTDDLINTLVDALSPRREQIRSDSDGENASDEFD